MRETTIPVSRPIFGYVSNTDISQKPIGPSYPLSCGVLFLTPLDTGARSNLH